MADFKYKEGDKVIVGPKTIWHADGRYIGRKGNIKGRGWRNVPTDDKTGNTYNIRFSDDGIVRPFFEEDLSPDNIDTLIAFKEAELEALKAEREKEKQLSIPANLAVTSAIFFPPNQLVIKVAPNKWHWYSVDAKEMQFHSISQDKAVSNDIETYIKEGKEYQIHRPTDL